MKNAPQFVAIVVVLAFVIQTQAQEFSTTAHVDYALSHDGDLKRGQEVFENDKAQCANCHRITGKEKSGPNLDGIGDKYTRKELVTHILDPSLQIAPGYEQATVLLEDGRAINGRFERATKIEIRVIDATGKQTNVKRKDVESVQYSQKSLMPDNLAASISKEKFADLIAYLASLKFGIKDGLGAGGKRVPIPHVATPVKFVRISPLRFESPVWCGPLPGQPGEFVVLEHQEAKAWRIFGDQLEKREVFLDLSDSLHISPNQGLMCFAFHPNFVQNRRYFVEHEVEEGGFVKTLIVERHANDAGTADSGAKAIRHIEVEQPAFNHNGGCIDFGPDGMLYAAFGDGGPQRDPEGYSQSPAELKGSFIRIDVNHKSNGKPYSIPADNPYQKPDVENLNARPETWAIGFREPWRFSFDTTTGDLWVGDVGQGEFEEVTIVKAGENHGWNVYEAFAPFSDEYAREGEQFVEPVFAYDHGLGFSGTGGYVYRARKQSSFHGVYVFGDFNTRRVWGLRHRNGQLDSVRELGRAPGGIASFGLDHNGEILLVTYEGGIYRLDFSISDYDEISSTTQ